MLPVNFALPKMQENSTHIASSIHYFRTITAIIAKKRPVAKTLILATASFSSKSAFAHSKKQSFLIGFSAIYLGGKSDFSP